MSDVAALVAVVGEWLALGWLSAVAWPGEAGWGSIWALRLLVGAALTGFAMLLLALFAVSFGVVPLVLGVGALLALALRLVQGARGEPRVEALDLARVGAPVDAREVAPVGVPAKRRPDVLGSFVAPMAHGPGALRSVVAPADRRASALRGLSWLALALVLVAIVVRSFVVPEAGWDAYSHWGLKAKAAFLAGAIVDTNTAHEYYPPLVPLLEAWLYVHRGAAFIDLGKTAWAPLGAGFVVCLAQHLRLLITRAWLAPLLALGLLLATPELLEGFSTGQGDLALTAYLTLATLALFQWQRHADSLWLVQAAVFGAAAGLTKYEGLFRVAVVVLAIVLEALLARRAPLVRPAVVLAAATALGYLPWAFFRAVHHIEVTPEHISHLQLGATGAVLLALGAAFSGVRVGGGLVVAAIGWIGVGWRQLCAPPFRLLTLAVLGQVLATLLAFLITDYSPVLQVQLSATRLVEQWLPLALFVVAVWSVDAEPYTARVG